MTPLFDTTLFKMKKTLTSGHLRTISHLIRSKVLQDRRLDRHVACGRTGRWFPTFNLLLEYLVLYSAGI